MPEPKEQTEAPEGVGTPRPYIFRPYTEQTITWRGSITDLATDVAYLLTRQDGADLIHELQRFLTLPHLADKFQGKR